MSEFFPNLHLHTRSFKGKVPLVFILSGAGLSAESGIPTYRDPKSGWMRDGGMDMEDLERSPQRVADVINRRMQAYAKASPNAAHRAIAEFEKRLRFSTDVVHVTQNIDSLCEEAGDTCVFHMHGDLMHSSCRKCGASFPRVGLYEKDAVCPVCGATEWAVRTSVVLFGEVPYGIKWIQALLKSADFFIAVGTSGVVYPAADFVRYAKRHRCLDRILISKALPAADPSSMFDDPDDPAPGYSTFLRGDATSVLPVVLKAIEERIRTLQKEE